METTPKEFAEKIVQCCERHPYADFTAKEILPLAKAYLIIVEQIEFPIRTVEFDTPLNHDSDARD